MRVKKKCSRLRVCFNQVVVPGSFPVLKKICRNCSKVGAEEYVVSLLILTVPE